ncbi:MAG: L-threonate dehydrogenase [Pseudomonadota bacterium]
MGNSAYKAAVIGLGSMGWGAAVSLLKAGIETVGVDIRDNVLEHFSAQGGRITKSPAEAAGGCDAVLVFVVNAEQTETVLFGPDGAVSAAPKGCVFLTCATTPPEFAEQIAGRLIGEGMLVVDAPVSGGAAKALDGDMTIMASGSDEAFEKAKPATDAIANKVYRLGSAAGAGSRVKMINQLLAGVHIAATAEAMTLGIKSGVDPKTLYDVICASAGQSWMFENRGPHIVEGDYDPKSAVDIFVKDLGIVTSEGERQAFPLPLAETALQQFKAAQDAGLGRQDDAAVAKIYAKRGNINLPGQN